MSLSTVRVGETLVLVGMSAHRVLTPVPVSVSAASAFAISITAPAPLPACFSGAPIVTLGGTCVAIVGRIDGASATCWAVERAMALRLH